MLGVHQTYKKNYHFSHNVETNFRRLNDFLPDLQTQKLLMELNHNQIQVQIDLHQGEYWQTSNFYVSQAADIAHANILSKEKKYQIQNQKLEFENETLNLLSNFFHLQ